MSNRISIILMILFAGLVQAQAQSQSSGRASSSWSTLPTLAAGGGWSGPTAQPAQRGAAGTPGFADDAIAEWDPQESAPYSIVSAPAPVCVVAYHNQGIATVTIGLDGTYTPARYVGMKTAKNGANETFYEYCANLDPTSISDGPHELRAVVTPVSGWPRVLQSGANLPIFADEAMISSGPHGLVPGKQIVAWNAVGNGCAASPSKCFNTKSLYVVSGAWTGNSYALSPADLLYHSPPYYTPNNTSIAVGAPTVVSQNNAYAAGQAIVIQQSSGGQRAYKLPNGLAFNTVYFVCSTNLTTVSYQLSTTYADATGGNCDVTTSGQAGGGVSAWPVVDPGESGTLTAYYADAQTTEIGSTMAESLFLLTNQGGAIKTHRQYVSTGGDDRGCAVVQGESRDGSSERPCATIHQAVANLAMAGGEAKVIVGTGGCAKFTMKSHGFMVGDAVQVTGTLASSFALAAGSTSIKNQTYFVIAADYAANGAFEVAATPLGNCIGFGSGGFADVVVTPDLSGANVYLMCPVDCRSPAQYALAGPNERGQRVANLSYLSILPSLGFDHAQVQLNSAGNDSTGIRVPKLRVAVDVVPRTATLQVAKPTTPYRGSASSGTTTFASNSVVSFGNELWAVKDGGGCLADGSNTRNGNYFMDGNYVTEVNGNNITTRWGSFTTCDVGTSITFEVNWSLLVGMHLWLDNMSYTGPGQWVANSTVAGFGSAWPGGMYLTSSTITENLFGASYFNYVWNVYATHTGSVAFNSVSELVSSKTDHNGTDWSFTSAATRGGYSTSTLTLTSSTWPALIRTGMVVTGPGIPANDYIIAYDASAFTITLAVPPTPVAGARSLVLSNNTHQDINFTYGNADNRITANLYSDYATNIGEGYFLQFGPFFDMALAYSTLGTGNGGKAPLYAIILEGNDTNNYFLNNTINATNGWAIAFREDLAYVPVSVYFSGNMCAFDGNAGAIGASAALRRGSAQIHVAGGTCGRN